MARQHGPRGYLDIAAWAALGHESRAVSLARERLSTGTLPPSIAALVSGLLHAIEGNTDGVLKSIDGAIDTDDPEGTLYHARHLSKCGAVERSLELLRVSAVERRYGCARLLRGDPWFDKVRTLGEFRALLEAADECEKTARLKFRRGSGDSVLSGGTAT